MRFPSPPHDVAAIVTAASSAARAARAGRPARPSLMEVVVPAAARGQTSLARGITAVGVEAYVEVVNRAARLWYGGVVVAALVAGAAAFAFGDYRSPRWVAFALLTIGG